MSVRRLQDQHLGKVAGRHEPIGTRAIPTPNRGGRWTRLAKAYRSAHPVCEGCGRRAASEVHHIVPVEIAPDQVYKWGNLASLCKGCHFELHETPPASSGTANPLGTAGGRLEKTPAICPTDTYNADSSTGGVY